MAGFLSDNVSTPPILPLLAIALTHGNTARRTMMAAASLFVILKVKTLDPFLPPSPWVTFYWQSDTRPTCRIGQLAELAGYNCVTILIIYSVETVPNGSMTQCLWISKTDRYCLSRFCFEMTGQVTKTRLACSSTQQRRVFAGRRIHVLAI
jgi:hypothetical protein